MKQSFIHLDTINNGINNNNNTYIGNFRVQHNDNSTSPNQQMMSQMTDGFKPFYSKKYEYIRNFSHVRVTINQSSSPFYP
jgi:hypothetical protein